MNVRWFVFALSALVAGTAGAEWKVLATVSDAAPGMAFDPTRTRFEPPYQTSWVRVVLAAPAQLPANGVRYQSVLQKVAVDCEARSWAVTYSEFYSGTDPRGTAAWFYSVPREDWDLRPARAGSNGARIVGALCSTPKAW